MEKIALADNLQLSRVIAGCMRTLDAGMDGEKLRAFVHSCLEMGVDTFDHAPVYGAGRCEQIFGDEVLKKDPSLRERIRIVTKAGIILPGQRGNSHIYYDSTKENLLAEMDASLARLCTDHVDLLLIHRPDVLGDPGEIAEALETIVKCGKALQVGVSNYEPAGFEALQSFLDVKLAANQMEFSVKATDNFFNGVVDTARRYRSGLMAWSPLGGGSVFTGQDEQSVRLRKTLQEIAGARGTTMDAIMYAFLYRHPANICVITGTMNTARMKTAVEALDIELSYDEWYGILAASRGFDVP
ncbi:MAG: aldo/keto reductase [Blautia sp.]|nr:aldo/keto reductase [Blautia sp.]